MTGAKIGFVSRGPRGGTARRHMDIDGRNSEDFNGGIKAKWLGYILQELSLVTHWAKRAASSWLRRARSHDLRSPLSSTPSRFHGECRHVMSRFVLRRLVTNPPDSGASCAPAA